MKTAGRQQRKTESRRRILEAASRLFRSQGYAATGIDEIMKRAGLTAGAFYAHFESKQRLLREALEAAFEESAAWARERGASQPAEAPRERLEAFFAHYLSAGHRDHPELGCPLPGIAAELGRHSEQTAEPVSASLERWVEACRAAGLSRPEALRRIAATVGALLLSRLTRGTRLSDELLKAARS